MLDVKSIDFLEAVVASRPINPVLRDICVNEGNLQVSDGKITANVTKRLFLDHKFTTNAEKFLRAMRAVSMDEAKDIKLNVKKHLSLSSGGFRVRMALSDFDAYPFILSPEESMYTGCFGLVDTLKLLRPFVGNVAKTAPWTCGIQFVKDHAYATNNIILVRTESLVEINEDVAIVLPVFTIDALIKIGEDPDSMATDGKQAWFLYSDGRWLQSVLIDATWPPQENLNTMLKGTDKDIPLKHSDINKLVPFCDDSDTQVIILDGKKMSTTEGNTLAEIEGDTVVGNAKFRAKPLISVLKIADRADFSSEHVPFGGDYDGVQFVGVMVGVRS